MSTAPSGLGSFATSIAAYEAWMRAELGDTLDAKSLRHKHRRMREHPFLFLRATCWRWAEAAPFLCPELIEAPLAASVGDAHAGNFGLWRDGDSRLVWGVNDLDEAARLPWCLDLVRLAASVLLAIRDPGPRAAADAILTGYAAGIADPRPFVLERDNLWLRDAFAADDVQREEFWAEIEAEPATRKIDEGLRELLLGALPDPAMRATIARREAGAGSLGRPRFVAWGEHRGGPVAAEIKGVLPSCWTRYREPGLPARIAASRFRSPDPHFLYAERHVTRRLAPNSRKLKFAEISARMRKRLLWAMGADIAAIHAGDEADRAAIARDLARRNRRWLDAAAIRVADWTAHEHARYAR